MKKLIPIVLLSLLMPQVAMAAWWNPWSWNWGSFKRSERASEVLKLNAEKKTEKASTTPQAQPRSVSPGTPSPAKIEIRANGVKGQIKQTSNVVISWSSPAKECTLTLEDVAYLVPGTGSKEFTLSFSDPYDTKRATFWIGCSFDGRWISDNVVVGGLAQ